MKKSSWLVLLLILPSISLACNNDFECGFGNKCVKPNDSISLQGICVTPTDQFGNRDYSTSYAAPSAEPHEVEGCMFDTDCDIGFTCMKKAGELKGICIKQD